MDEALDILLGQSEPPRELTEAEKEAVKREYPPEPDVDPTRVDLSIDGGGVDPYTDPLTQRIGGTAIHGNTPFNAPFISHIVGNLYQGGCTNGLVLPEKIKHVISLYKWERYTIKHEGVKRTEITMYDASQEPDREEVISLAKLVHESCKDGPTLVHCQAGLNRSSLIAGAALVLDGYSPEEAIKLLRSKRSPACLCNQTFEKFLLGFRPSAVEVGNVPTAEAG